MNNKTIWIASFLVVVIVFHICYGLQTILPGNVSWLMTVKHDWGGHYLGWLFYKNESWHFPLGAVHSYFYPVATNVGFTDSIPLLAIFFKLFSPVLPGDFQYFGLWLFLCHLLAAYYTILLFRLFKINDWYTFFAVIFVAANPVLIYRGMHPALCAHWLFIASIYVYFLDPRVVRPAKILRFQFILLILAAFINPYLCLMVLGFSFCTAIKLCFVDKAVLKKDFFVYTGASLFSLWLSLYVIGIVSFGKTENVGVEGGYGLYGLNLHSLYNSFGFSSFFRGIKQVTPHQYEGYMYLGLGMFLILFILLVYAFVSIFLIKNSREETKERFVFNNTRLLPLCILLILFTLFAISNVVTLNDKILFKIPLPKAMIHIGDIFRASARFFWPAYYLVFFFAIIALAKTRIPSAWKWAILGIAIILQLYDTKLLFTYRKLSYGVYEPPVDTKSWQALMDRFENVVMYPPFATTNLENMDYQYFCYIAGKMGKPITTGYVARYDNKSVQDYNDSLTSQLEEGRLSPASLYITTAANLHYFSFSLLVDSGRLNYLDGYYYIVAQRKNDTAVLALSERLNSPHKSKIDSAYQAVSPKTEFIKLSDPAALEAGTIRNNIERFKENDKYLSLVGWAFKENTQDNRNDSVFFVLKGEKDVYIAPVISQSRPDVTGHFKRQNLDNAGFSGFIFYDNVEKGVYTLEIVIKDKQGMYTYMPTDKSIKVHINEFSALEKIAGLPPMADIVFNAETIKSDDKQVMFQGWAFLNNQDAGDSRIGIVLKNENDIYVSFSEPMLRPDVTAHFKNRNKLDNSGFSIKLLKTALPKGRYQIGILIRDNKKNKQGVIFTGKEIDI